MVIIGIVNSNTTLVKVKCSQIRLSFSFKKDSNTTLVKVKFRVSY